MNYCWTWVEIENYIGNIVGKKANIAVCGFDYTLASVSTWNSIRHTDNDIGCGVEHVGCLYFVGNAIGVTFVEKNLIVCYCYS